MRFWRSLFYATGLALGLACTSPAQDIPQIRAATLAIGTVSWELSTIKDQGFDKKHGFELVIQPYADNAATRIALEGGAADMAVADFIWAARQRAGGKDLVVIPYSKAVGGLVVPHDSTVTELRDLKGARIGIAGGPLDKSWLILRAYAEKTHKMDLAAETEQVYGAPPLIYKIGLSGEVQGSVNFWHFLAKMKANGMREVISVAEAAESLGLDPETPLLGYVFKEKFLNDNPGLAHAFYRASRDAKEMLATDDSVWDRLRPQMNVRTDSEFRALQSDFRAGIPDDIPVSPDLADRFLRLMARLGGQELVGKATTLPAGLFADVQ